MSIHSIVLASAGYLFSHLLYAEVSESQQNLEARNQQSTLRMFFANRALSRNQRSEVFTDLQSIVREGVLTVALLKDDIFPFFFKDPEQGFVGIDRELINAIANALGHHMKLKIIRTAKSYDELVRQVHSGVAHLGVSKLNYTPGRSLLVHFGTQPYMILHPAILIHKKYISSPKGFNVNNFFSNKEKRIVCTLNRSSDSYIMKELFPKAKAIVLNAVSERNRSFENGACHALLLDDYDLKTRETLDPNLRKHYQVVILDNIETPLYVVTNPRYANLSRFVDDLIRNSSWLQFKLDKSFSIYKKYLKQLKQGKPSAQDNLSDQDIQEINSQPEIISEKDEKNVNPS